jgi:hypothetical protein
MNQRDDAAVRAVFDQVYAAFAANDADASSPPTPMR